MLIVRIIIAAVLALFLISGMRRGLIRQVLEVVGLVVAFIMAFYMAQALAAWIAGRVDLDYRVALTIAAVAIFVGIIVVFHWIGLAMQRFFKMTILGIFDRIAGAVFGVLKGLMLISLVLVIILAAPFPRDVKERILDDPVTASIYPILPVMYDLVVTRIPGGERFESVARIGGSETLEETTERLRREIEEAGEELEEKAGELKGKAEDTARELKDKATD
ncbi:MAG: CvpA family protein [Candidatus Krumholzibacteria bacterium]|nr:CvpA family protein [Candidatus Krumholzibacteria bacterium]